MIQYDIGPITTTTTKQDGHSWIGLPSCGGHTFITCANFRGNGSDSPHADVEGLLLAEANCTHIRAINCQTSTHHQLIPYRYRPPNPNHQPKALYRIHRNSAKWPPSKTANVSSSSPTASLSPSNDKTAPSNPRSPLEAWSPHYLDLPNQPVSTGSDGRGLK